MAKEIRYKFISCEVDKGTEGEPILEQIILDATITCLTETEYNTSYPIAEAEAIPGTIEVTGEFEDLPQVQTAEERIAELEAALSLLLEGATE